MWMNFLKVGGSAMVLNELVKRAIEIKQSQEKTIRSNRTKNVVIGTGIGTVLGVAAGILFAPKAGKETRQQIVEETGKVAKSMKDNIDTIKTKMADTVKETGSKLHEAGAQCVDAAKESLKEKEDVKPKDTKK